MTTAGFITLIAYLTCVLGLLVIGALANHHFIWRRALAVVGMYRNVLITRLRTLHHTIVLHIEEDGCACTRTKEYAEDIRLIITGLESEEHQ